MSNFLNSNSSQGAKNPLSGLMMIGLGILMIFLLFKGLSILYWLMKWVAPFLILGTFLIRKEVLFNYANGIVKQLKTNPLMGALSVLVTVLAYPFVSMFLFGRAVLANKIDSFTGGEESNMSSVFNEDEEEEFADFEEVESTLLDFEEKKFEEDSGYDDLLSDDDEQSKW